MQHKTITSVRVKDADQGLIEAVFASHLVTASQLKNATADVIDKDGDVTLKGAFTEGQNVVISAYGHGSWEGRLPVGKGVIREQDDLAVCEMKFFMDTTHGRDTFLTIKELSDGNGGESLQEWSYSLHDVKASRAQVAGRNVRVLEQIALVKEVSPVLMGAGVQTRTLDVKARKQLATTLARMLGEAGSARWETRGSYVYLDDFDIDDSTAVFCVVDYSAEPRERYRLQVDFTRTDTSVTLGEVETEVEYTTVYLPKGTKFADHHSDALRAVKGVVEMAVERLALRVAEGKSVTEQISAYEQLVAELSPLKSAIDATTTIPDGLEREFLKFVSLAQGV